MINIATLMGDNIADTTRDGSETFTEGPQRHHARGLLFESTTMDAVEIAMDVAYAVPTTPRSRIEQALTEAIPALFSLCRTARIQTGHDPYMVVATADSTIGEEIIRQHFGRLILPSLAGPVVLVYSLSDVIALDPKLIDAFAALKPVAPDVSVIVAVNGETLDAMVLRQA